MSKRILSILLAGVVILSLAAVTATVSYADTSPLLGDADGDGDVLILDATTIQRILVSLPVTGFNKDAADTDSDGVVTIIDATNIQRYLTAFKDGYPIGKPIQAPTQPATQRPTGQPATANPTQAPTVKPTEPPTQPPTEAPQPEEPTKVKDNITVYFSNNKNWTTVNAYIYKQSTGTAMSKWPGTAMTYVKTNNEGEKVYSVTVDVTRYDRIIFNNGTDQTTDTPITKASSGYFLDPAGKGKDYGGKYLAGLYPYGETREGSIKTVSMDYPDGYKKKVYIWTPAGYNAADKSKKYSVLYMCDGQNLFGQKTTLSGFEWECDETVLSLMKNGGDGVIVVGVDNSTNKRDHELTPNIGKLSATAQSYGSSFANGGGKVYSDFMVDTVIPYVEANYNTNSIRGVAGSSSGGIEAFYIGMEHMDKFRYVGALSPAFLLFDKSVWDTYLGAKDFSGNVPRVYFFNGNGNDQLEQELYKDAVAMEGWMKAKGYPADKMKTVVDNDGTHSEGFWAVYFPEMLSWGLNV